MYGVTSIFGLHTANAWSVCMLSCIASKYLVSHSNLARERVVIYIFDRDFISGTVSSWLVIADGVACHFIITTEW